MITVRFPHSSDLSIYVTQALSWIGQARIDIHTGIAIVYQKSINKYNITITTSTIQIVQIISAIRSTIAGVIWAQVVPILINQRSRGEIIIEGAMNQMKYIWRFPESQFEQVISTYGDVRMIFSAVFCALAGFFSIIIYMINPVNVHGIEKFDGKINEEHQG